MRNSHHKHIHFFSFSSLLWNCWGFLRVEWWVVSLFTRCSWISQMTTQSVVSKCCSIWWPWCNSISTNCALPQPSIKTPRGGTRREAWRCATWIFWNTEGERWPGRPTLWSGGCGSLGALKPCGKGWGEQVCSYQIWIHVLL